MRIVLLVLAVGFLLACATEADVGEDRGVGAPIPYFGPSSLEERIASHRVVVRGTLDKTTSEVVAATGKWEGQYAVVIKFHLTVSEYLRGSGESNVIAVWGSSYPHATEAEAEATRPKLVEARPTTWDDQEAVFFLHDETYDLFSALEAPDVYFLGYSDDFDSDDGFSINSRFDRTWLPAADDGGGGVSGASGDDNRRFRLGPPPFPALSSGGGGAGASEDEDPTITIARLKELIALVEADIAKGDGSVEYEFCVETKYELLSVDAYLKLAPNRDPLHDLGNALTESSGQAASTVLFSQQGYLYTGPPERKSKLTLDGPDAELFTISETTPEIIIEEPPRVDRFEYQVRAKRPLRVGTYKFHSHYSHHIAAECTEHPLVSYEVEATFTNENAVYEAFFDPVTVTHGSGQVSIGSDASNGSISPWQFDYGDDSPAVIKSILWREGRVYVEVIPLAAVGGLQLQFTREDGTVLKLPRENLNIFFAQNMIGYHTPEQPYEAGDKLLVGFYR